MPAAMMEEQRRGILAALNSRYIYGKLPLLHTIVFLFQMAAVSLLIQGFTNAYAQKPILTTMMVNATLGGIADTTAQTLTSFQRRMDQRRHQSKPSNDNAIEIQDLNSKGSWPAGEIVPDKSNLPPPFDFERLTRFMSYGFLIAPLQFKWYGFLTSIFPITKAAATMPALKRVAFDQTIMAPVGLCLFFSFMTIAEGGGRRALGKKFQDVFIPSLKANYVLWPAVQFMNFRFVPLSLQIPFVSTIGIAWTAYLSLTNASDD